MRKLSVPDTPSFLQHCPHTIWASVIWNWSCLEMNMKKENPAMYVLGMQLHSPYSSVPWLITSYRHCQTLLGWAKNTCLEVSLLNQLCSYLHKTWISYLHTNSCSLHFLPCMEEKISSFPHNGEPSYILHCSHTKQFGSACLECRRLLLEVVPMDRMKMWRAWFGHAHTVQRPASHCLPPRLPLERY